MFKTMGSVQKKIQRAITNDHKEEGRNHLEAPVRYPSSAELLLKTGLQDPTWRNSPCALQPSFLMVIMDACASPLDRELPGDGHCAFFICVSYDQPCLHRHYPQMKYQWLHNKKRRKAQSGEVNAIWETSWLQPQIFRGYRLLECSTLLLLG